LPALGAVVILGLLLVYFERDWGGKKSEALMYSVLVHKVGGSWVYDSEEEGLFQRKLSDSLQDNMGLYNKKLGTPDRFIVTFSTEEIAGYDDRITYRRRSGGGYWYYSSVNDEEVWMSGALAVFYGTPPEVLYSKCSPVSE
jgi:hypothetical protein